MACCVKIRRLAFLEFIGNLDLVIRCGLGYWNSASGVVAFIGDLKFGISLPFGIPGI